jgi:hypothetical protein
LGRDCKNFRNKFGNDFPIWERTFSPPRRGGQQLCNASKEKTLIKLRLNGALAAADLADARGLRSEMLIQEVRTYTAE